MTVRLYALVKFALAFSKERCPFQSANLEQAQSMFMSESPQTCPAPYRSPWRICFDLFQTVVQRDPGLGWCPGVPALWYSPSFSQKDLQVLALCLDDEQPARSVVREEGSMNTLALMDTCCAAGSAFHILGAQQAFIFGGILGGFDHHSSA